MNFDEGVRAMLESQSYYELPVVSASNRSYGGTHYNFYKPRNVTINNTLHLHSMHSESRHSSFQTLSWYTN